MIDTLSQLIRKPHKMDDHELNQLGWIKKRDRVLDHMKEDRILNKLLDEFKVVNERLRFVRSTKDVKIYFVEMENGPDTYLYARTFFNINGRSKEFRKYLGRTDEIQVEKINQDQLKQLFLQMLKNFLEYQE